MALHFDSVAEAATYFKLRDRIDTQFSKVVRDVNIAGILTKACIFNGQDFYAAYRDRSGNPQLFWVELSTMKEGHELPPGIFHKLLICLLRNVLPDVLLSEWHRGQLGVNLDMIGVCGDHVQEYLDYCHEHNIH